MDAKVAIRILKEGDRKSISHVTIGGVHRMKCDHCQKKATVYSLDDAEERIRRHKCRK